MNEVKKGLRYLLYTTYLFLRRDLAKRWYRWTLWETRTNTAPFFSHRANSPSHH